MPVHVRKYLRRRVGTANGIEVHVPPVPLNVIRSVPAHAELVTREQLEVAGETEAVGADEQYLFIAKKDGKVQGILVGFYLGERAHGMGLDLNPLWQEVLSKSAYIDAMETYERRAGIGRKLVEAFEQWARERGAKFIAGSPVGEEARAFDESLGLKPHPRDYHLWVKKL